MVAVGRITDIWAISDKGFDDAVQLAVRRASDTLRGLTSAEVQRQEILLRPGGGIEGYKVTLRVGFVLDEYGDSSLPAVPNPATQTADFG